MSKVVIIHYYPLELYPPIQNLIIELEKTHTDVVVLTTRNSVEYIMPFSLKSKSILVKRIGESSSKSNTLIRYINYVYFFSAATLLLLFYYPKRVLYFETISSLPGYLYKYLFNKSCELYIHYHEYTSTQEYESGMKLNKIFHKFESRLYPEATWVSHTNEYRMRKFKDDIYPIILRNAEILPNYPPRAWQASPKKITDEKVRVVYVGALGLSTMYVKEFAEWVLNQNGKIVWDIYSHNYTLDAKYYLENLKSSYIKMHVGVNYDKLPSILKKYEVGVVLYKGHIDNYIYNAPNKLFEYLTTGLSVCFPDEMIGCYEYVTSGTYPQVIKLNFKNIKAINWKDFLLLNEKSIEKQFSFSCEESLLPLVNKLCAS